MKHRLALSVLGLSAFTLAACGGSAGAGKKALTIVEVANGFGRLLPHMIFEADALGNPTATLIAIRTQNDLLQNVTAANAIRPTAQWPLDARLPNNAPGNHFLYAEFSEDLDIDSVLGPNGLKGPITVVAVDGLTGNITPIPGKVFVGGMTYLPGNPTPVALVTDNGVTGDGTLVMNPDFLEQIPGFDVYTHPAEGFPGAIAPLVDVNGSIVPAPGVLASTPFLGADVLVSPRTLVFIPDEDDTLETFDTFPTGVQVRMRLTTAVLSVAGRNLAEPALGSSTVGPDTVAPEVSLTPAAELNITPGSGAVNVDPAGTEIIVSFSEPVQLQTVSTLDGQGFPNVSAPIQITFGPSVSSVTIPFSLRVPSVYDLTTLVLLPAYDFPPNGPTSAPCNNFNRIDVTVFPGQFADLASTPNLNTTGGNSFFFTGQGTGVTNAPVTPDTIYIGRFGGSPSLSVIDLNGFGASTGTPSYEITQPIKQGNSNYPNNPNVTQGSFLNPLLQAGTCTFNGGSQGVFTLTKNSALSDQLLTAPEIESIADMMLGHPLDSTFNNGPPPFGCQAGGGNPCAFSGFKAITANVSGAQANTLSPSAINQFGGTSVPGGENIASWAPHPNPPPLVYPPICLSPFIGGQEPTSIKTSSAGGIATGIGNLLNPGANALGNPAQAQPPSTLLTREQNAWFVGPSPATDATSNSCAIYQMRQQVGHFLYVVDRVRREVVVLNSNRMTVLDRIPIPDPTSLAMSPNLDLLAVTNQSAGVVSFIDINPSSSNFHKVIKETDVGLFPRGLAWEPGNEDIFVCNEGDDSVSIISAFNLEVRKTLQNQLNGPFDVAITPRQTGGIGFGRNVYFAYILNRDGKVSIFESGPNGANGWGFDEIVLQPQFVFTNPKAIQPDHINLSSGVWIVHENSLSSNGQPTGLTGGAVSNLVLTSASIGQVPLPIGGGNQVPTARDMEWSVQSSIGSNVLTGTPVDIAFDNQMNLSGLVGHTSNFSAGSPVLLNGKAILNSNSTNSNEPTFMFLAVPNSTQGGGVIDVIRLSATITRTDTNVFVPGIQSIPAQGAEIVMDYFRQ